jgi:hypothetical protein
MSHLMIKQPRMDIPRLHFIFQYVAAFMVLNLIPVVTSGFSTQSANDPPGDSTKEQSLFPLIVQFDQPLNFNAPDGQIVVVPSGTYLVEPVTQGEPRLVFWHEHGSATLQAARTSHDQRVETPEAYLIREDDDEDILHVVVFIPDGTAFESTGSVSGIQTRGKFRVSRHYQLDPATGVVQFGDGQQGRRLPTGQSNISPQYRQGSGSQESKFDVIEQQSCYFSANTHWLSRRIS